MREDFTDQARQLGEMFHLTAAEARVALLLATGLSVTEIAERLTLQPGSVRQHLKSIFGKTGTHGQAQLVHRLLTLKPGGGLGRI